MKRNGFTQFITKIGPRFHQQKPSWWPVHTRSFNSCHHLLL